MSDSSSQFQTETGPCWKRPQVGSILLIAVLAEIGYATLNLSTMPVYLTADRKFGESVVGLVLFAFLLCEAAFKSVTGHFADRFGTRTLMIAGPAVSIFTCCAGFLIPHTNASSLEVLAFIGLRALDGLAVAMLWPAAFAQMNAVVEDHERQQAMSYLNTCYMVGIALAYPIGGIANDLSGTKWAGIVLSLFLFIGASFAAYRMTTNAPVPPAATAHSSSEGGGIAAFIDSLRQIPEYLLLAMVTFIGVGFPIAIFKLFPVQEFKMSESVIGLMILPGAMAMAFLGGRLAKLGESLGPATAVHRGLAICSIGVWMIAVGAFLPFLRHPLFLGLAALPIGIGFLLTIPAWMTSVSDLNPSKRATNLGAIMTAQGVGALIGTPIGSLAYEKLQPLGRQVGLGESMGRYSPFVGCALCITAGWLLSLKVLKAPIESEALPQVATTVPAETTGVEATVVEATVVETTEQMSESNR